MFLEIAWHPDLLTLLVVSAPGRGLKIWRVLHTCSLFLVVVVVVVLVVCCSSVLYFCVCFSLCLTSILDVAEAGAFSKPLASSGGRCFALLVGYLKLLIANWGEAGAFPSLFLMH